MWIMNVLFYLFQMLYMMQKEYSHLHLRNREVFYAIPYN